MPILVVPIVWGVAKWVRPHKSTLERDLPTGSSVADPREQNRATSFSSSGSDLDDLARLFSQDVIVGNNEFRRPGDGVWIDAIMKLRSSSEKAVAATIAAAKDAITARADALGLDSKVTKEIKDRMDAPIIKSRGEIVGMVLDMYTEDQLSEMERDAERRHLKGEPGAELSPEVKNQIEAWRHERAERNPAGKAVGNLVESVLQRRAADSELRAVRQQADIWESEKFAEHLGPALRARAGAKIDATPLALKVARRSLAIRKSSEPLAETASEPMVLVSGSSRHDRELTRLTLLFELRLGNGSRFFAAYLPRLRPSESFRLFPVPYPFRGAVKGLDRPVAPPGKEFRYSAWCDQFAIEDRELPPEAYEGATLAYGVQALRDNTAYLCDPVKNPFGGHAPAVARTKESRPASSPQRAYVGRYGLTFTELKPEGDAYRIQARLDQYEVDSKEKIESSVTFAGVLHAGPEKKQQPTPLAVPLAELGRQRREAKAEEDKKKLEESKKKRATSPPKTRAEQQKEAAQEREKAAQDRQAQTIQRKLDHADLVCELEAEGNKHLFEIRIEANGQLKWTALDLPLKTRSMLPAEQVKQRDQRVAENRDKNDRLRKAIKLATHEGKKDEAEKALNEFIASSPGEIWEKSARYVLGKLDWYAAQAAQAKQKAMPDERATANRQSYERSVAEARGRLLGAIDENINRLEKDAGLDKSKVEEAVGRLRLSKGLLEKYGRVPWAKEFWSETSAYVSALADARAKVLASYGEAPIPEDLKNLIDRQVVAVWRQQPGLDTISFYSHGAVNHPDFPHTWSFHEGQLTIRWQYDRTTYVVDVCEVAPDGFTYTGHDHAGEKISGVLLNQSVFPVATMRRPK